MNQITIGAVTTAVISYKDQRVCTTQQLAQLYGAEPHQLRQNYRNNKTRFEEGKHFIKLEGEELRAFKDNRVDKSYSQESGPSNARAIMLWTERGAARHAKMLETDQAWDVFEQMEDSYFAAIKARPPVANGHERSTKHDRLPLYHFTVDTVIKHKLMFNKVYQLINLFAGTHSFKEMSKEQAAQVADFCDRFALGHDTRNDWQRIADNQADLFGEPSQVDMVQKLLLS